MDNQLLNISSDSQLDDRGRGLDDQKLCKEILKI